MILNTFNGDKVSHPLKFTLALPLRGGEVARRVLDEYVFPVSSIPKGSNERAGTFVRFHALHRAYMSGKKSLRIEEPRRQYGRGDRRVSNQMNCRMIYSFGE